MLDSVEALLKAASLPQTTAGIEANDTISNISANAAVPTSSLPRSKSKPALTEPIDEYSSEFEENSDDISPMGSDLEENEIEDEEEEDDDETFKVRKQTRSKSSSTSLSSATTGTSGTSRYGTRSKMKKQQQQRSGASAPSASSRTSSNQSQKSSKGAENETTNTEDANNANATRKKSKWSCLETPLRCIDLPKLQMCNLENKVGLFQQNLVLVDTQSPTLEPIDSPSAWRVDTAPLRVEFIQKVMFPHYQLQHALLESLTSTHIEVKPKTSNPTRTATPLSQGATSSKNASSSAYNTLGANKKKRGRHDGTEAENDFDLVGDDVVGSNKRSKGRQSDESTSYQQSKSVRFEGGGLEGEGEDEEGRSGSGGLPNTLMKRRMSKGDESVEIKKLPDGSIEMPLNFVSITVLSLGEVVPNSDKFHSRRYIFPLGYKSRRSYYSLKDPNTRCDYTQEVILNPKNSKEPIFRLTCEDDPENPIQSSTPSGVWSEVLERIKPQREAIVGRVLHSTISGPEQFGFSHPIIHTLLQELPNADKCANYDPNLYHTPDARGKRKPKD